MCSKIILKTNILTHYFCMNESFMYECMNV